MLAERAGALEEAGLEHWSSVASAATQESGLPPNVPPRPPDVRRVHQLGAAGDAGERQAAAERLAPDDQVGLDAVEVVDRERLAGAAHAGLHLVVDVDDAVLAADRLDRPSRKPGVAGRKPPSPCTGS